MKVARLVLKFVLVGCKCYSRWWFKILFIFTTTWGNDPIWRAYFFKWVGSTTNQFSFFKGFGLPFYFIFQFDACWTCWRSLFTFFQRKEHQIYQKGHMDVLFRMWFLTFYHGKSAFLQHHLGNIFKTFCKHRKVAMISFPATYRVGFEPFCCWTSNFVAW